MKTVSDYPIDRAHKVASEVLELVKKMEEDPMVVAAGVRTAAELIQNAANAAIMQAHVLRTLK